MRLIILSVLVALAGTSIDAEEGAWRKQRHENLMKEESWLTLVGLHWLKDGEQKIENVVFVKNGEKVTADGKEIKSDANGTPDKIKSGRKILFLLKRGSRFAVRVKDPESPVRKNFKGIENYPPSADYVVIADFVPFEKPKKIKIPNILGTTEEMDAPGILKFKLQGKELSIEPVLESAEDREYFIIFKDETSGKTTYPAGRFLYSDVAKNGKVTLNFNRAYNPPCAFTPYATCPLPPKENVLSVAIEAGEKTYGHHK
jgi:uncharacterized protein